MLSLRVGKSVSFLSVLPVVDVRIPDGPSSLGPTVRPSLPRPGSSGGVRYSDAEVILPQREYVLHRHGAGAIHHTLSCHSLAVDLPRMGEVVQRLPCVS